MTTASPSDFLNSLMGLSKARETPQEAVPSPPQYDTSALEEKSRQLSELATGVSEFSPLPEFVRNRQALEGRLQQLETMTKELLRTAGLREDPQTGEMRFVPVEEEAREEMQREFGGRGGTAKKFLLNLMLGMAGAPYWVGGYYRENVKKRRAEALSMLREVLNEQRQILSGFTSLASTVQRAQAADRSSQIRALATAINAQRAIVNAEHMQFLDRVKALSEQSRINRNEMTMEYLRQKMAMGELGRDVHSDQGQWAASYAYSELLTNPKYEAYRDHIRAFPNDPAKWPAELRNEYQKLRHVGIMQYEQARRAREAARPMIRFFPFEAVQYDPRTGSVTQQKLVRKLVMDPKGNVIGDEMLNVGREVSADEMQKINAASSEMAQAQASFEAAKTNFDDESFFGLIKGHPALTAMRYGIGSVFGIEWDKVKNPGEAIARIYTNRNATSTWVERLYQYSGKQINQREMESMKQFIQNAQMTRRVFATMSAVSYYVSMANMARMGIEGFPLKREPGRDMSKAIIAATYWSLEKARRSGGGDALMTPEEFAKFVEEVDIAEGRKPGTPNPAVRKLLDEATRGLGNAGSRNK